jgi:hypothetical protein
VLYALVEINSVIQLAAALANEGQAHAIQEAQAAAQIRGRFRAREVGRGEGSGLRDCRGGLRSFDTRSQPGEIEMQLPRRRH